MTIRRKDFRGGTDIHDNHYLSGVPAGDLGAL
jgi:hypothetical protein